MALLGDAISDQLDFLTVRLAQLSQALRLAKIQAASPDARTAADGAAAFAAFRTQFLALHAQAAALRAQANAADAPSATMVALDQFSDQVLRVAHDVGVALPKAVGMLPLVLAGLGAVALLVYLPKRKRG